MEEDPLAGVTSACQHGGQDPELALDEVTASFQFLDHLGTHLAHMRATDLLPSPERLYNPSHCGGVVVQAVQQHCQEVRQFVGSLDQ